MRIINLGETVTPQTEELGINGVSIIFYSVCVLDKSFNDLQIISPEETDDFEQVQSNQGYIEKIFNINDSSKRDHLFFKCTKETVLPPINIDNGELIIPKINHYLSVYSRNIILVQSVLMFDKNKITNYCGITEINRPLKTSDILTIIHAIKNKGEDCNKAMSITVDKIIASFLKLAKKNNADIPLFPYLKIRNDQCLSIQIWDIASYCVEKGKAIIGEDLSLRYELELSALLSCYNEHFSSNELWKMQSANQVHRSALSRTDVLNDHQVLLSERVCLEISQVNYPKLRPISAKRLFTYGYDSTSIFLWGYLVIVSAGNEVCEIKASQLHEEMLILFSEKGEKNDKIEQMIVQKQLISREIDQYNALEKICIEERHKDFIKGGLKIKGLHNIQEHVERIFMSIKELSDTTLAADTSKTSSEISSLLKEVRSMNDKQSESSSRLSILGLILAFSAVVPITEFIIKIVPSWGNSISMLIILSATTLVLLFITLIIIYKKKK